MREIEYMVCVIKKYLGEFSEENLKTRAPESYKLWLALTEEEKSAIKNLLK